MDLSMNRSGTPVKSLFTARPEHWNSNRRPVTVSPAMLTDEDGHKIPGLHISQGSSWFVITQANAVEMANHVIDTIESSKAESESTA